MRPTPDHDSRGGRAIALPDGPDWRARRGEGYAMHQYTAETAVERAAGLYWRNRVRAALAARAEREEREAAELAASRPAPAITQAQLDRAAGVAQRFAALAEVAA